MLVRDIMTKNVITVYPDAYLKDVGRIFKEKRISGVPVVDKEAQLVGVVTLTDILRILGRVYKWREIEKSIPDLKMHEMFEKALDTKVENVMTKDVFILKEDDSLDDIMRLMFSRGAHTLPVVKDGKIVGVVGKRDLLGVCF